MEKGQVSHYFSEISLSQPQVQQKLPVGFNYKKLQFDDSARGELSSRPYYHDTCSEELLEPPTPDAPHTQGLTSWERALPGIRVVGPGYEARVHGSTAALTALKRARSAEVSTDSSIYRAPKQLTLSKLCQPAPLPAARSSPLSSVSPGDEALLVASLGSSPALPSPCIPALAADRAACTGKARRLEVQDSVNSVDFMREGVCRLSLDSSNLHNSSCPSSSSSTPRTNSLENLPQGCSITMERLSARAVGGGASLEGLHAAQLVIPEGLELSGRVHGHCSFSDLCHAAVLVVAQGAHQPAAVAAAGLDATSIPRPQRHRQLHFHLGKGSRLARLDSGLLENAISLEHP